MIGRDFAPYARRFTFQCCSECGERLPETALASYRNGEVKKVVCSEKCAEEFEARFWDTVAERNQKARPRRGRPKAPHLGARKAVPR
jgi:hypothetical protein